MTRILSSLVDLVKSKICEIRRCLLNSSGENINFLRQNPVYDAKSLQNLPKYRNI